MDFMRDKTYLIETRFGERKVKITFVDDKKIYGFDKDLQKVVDFNKDGLKGRVIDE